MREAERAAEAKKSAAGTRRQGLERTGIADGAAGGAAAGDAPNFVASREHVGAPPQLSADETAVLRAFHILCSCRLTIACSAML